MITLIELSGFTFHHLAIAYCNQPPALQ